MTMRESLIGGLVLSVMFLLPPPNDRLGYLLPCNYPLVSPIPSLIEASRERLTSLFANDTYHLFLGSRRIVAERKPFKPFD